MDDIYRIQRKKNFRSIYNLYFMMYWMIGILPVNIDNLLLYLPGSTKFGLGFTVVANLIVSTISILTFGYYGDKISEKYSRKRIFIITNAIWLISCGLSAFALDYFFYLILRITSAIGTGAFLPIGFSIISDSYPPKQRGNKFGMMQFGLILGSGMGIIFGGLLGSYTGPNGWRFAYGLAFIIGFFALFGYISHGIDPERGRAEPEFEDFEGVINYDYKITFNDLIQIFKMRSITSILISVLFSGIATYTLGVWGIYYLTSKIDSVEAELIATTFYLLAGMGALPGTIIGGKLGDSYFHSGKIRGRVIISIIGLILGVLFSLEFYLLPFFTATSLYIIFSWIFFVIIGFFGYFFSSFNVGNQFAIYSEVSVPELRGTVNGMNGVMVNIGGIIGNLLISYLIETNLTFGISLILFIWFFGTFFWVITYFYYPRELKQCRERLAKRRTELEKRSK